MRNSIVYRNGLQLVANRNCAEVYRLPWQWVESRKIQQREWPLGHVRYFLIPRRRSTPQSVLPDTQFMDRLA